LIQFKRQVAGLAISTLLFAIAAPVHSIGIIDAYSLARKRKYRLGGAAAEGIAQLPELTEKLANAKVSAKRFLWQRH
jgi:hypothetical protein